MRILFTGASSFTGYWFVRELHAAGHEVVATFRGLPESYEGLRRERVAWVADHCTAAFGCSFGSPAFLDLISGEPQWDLLCHHAADVTDYKSASFDFAGALTANTMNAADVLEALAARGCRRLLLTGSVFEGGEGAGSERLRAFSPYGLSKELTARAFAFLTEQAGLHLGKFVIPNPFGPFEEPRFTAYLVRTWSRGDTATVSTPDYVRDNVHVSLLARAYSQFAQHLPPEAGFSRTNPSGYVESQGRFAERFAQQMGPRLGLSCNLELAIQPRFDEPRMRVNTDPLDHCTLNWNEEQAWNELAQFYAERMLSKGKVAANG